MNRRQQRKLESAAAADRAARIARLLAVGLITTATEIPSNAIPVDPDRLNLGGSYHHPTYFRAANFTCVDCGAPQTWQAEDQRWYYETTGAPYYSTAVRCRPCRKREQERKTLARKASGHVAP